MNPEPLFFGFRGQEYPIGEFLNCRICERKTNYPDLDCRQGEAEYLPLPGDAVDYVFANMYLHHLSVVTVDCVGSNCCADSVDGSSSAKVSIFVASGTKR